MVAVMTVWMPHCPSAPSPFWLACSFLSGVMKSEMEPPNRETVSFSRRRSRSICIN